MRALTPWIAALCALSIAPAAAQQSADPDYTGRGLGVGDALAIYIGDRLQGDHSSIYLGEYLVVYRRQPDASLTGAWVYSNGVAEGSETLQPN